MHWMEGWKYFPHTRTLHMYMFLYSKTHHISRTQTHTHTLCGPASSFLPPLFYQKTLDPSSRITPGCYHRSVKGILHLPGPCTDERHTNKPHLKRPGSAGAAVCRQNPPPICVTFALTAQWRGLDERSIVCLLVTVGSRPQGYRRRASAAPRAKHTSLGEPSGWPVREKSL